MYWDYFNILIILSSNIGFRYITCSFVILKCVDYCAWTVSFMNYHGSVGWCYKVNEVALTCICMYINNLSGVEILWVNFYSTK